EDGAAIKPKHSAYSVLRLLRLNGSDCPTARWSRKFSPPTNSAATEGFTSNGTDAPRPLRCIGGMMLGDGGESSWGRTSFMRKAWRSVPVTPEEEGAGCKRGPVNSTFHAAYVLLPRSRTRQKCAIAAVRSSARLRVSWMIVSGSRLQEPD